MYVNQRGLTSPRSPSGNEKSSRPLAAYPPAHRDRNGAINRKTGSGYQAKRFYREDKHTGLFDILLKISLCSGSAKWRRLAWISRLLKKSVASAAEA
jgi:hypothetical protein